MGRSQSIPEDVRETTPQGEGIEKGEKEKLGFKFQISPPNSGGQFCGEGEYHQFPRFPICCCETVGTSWKLEAEALRSS